MDNSQFDAKMRMLDLDETDNSYEKILDKLNCCDDFSELFAFMIRNSDIITEENFRVSFKQALEKHCCTRYVELLYHYTLMFYAMLKVIEEKQTKKDK